jgi:hypothetical protein
MSKKILKKSLKTKKNKPYIVTHWHALLNKNQEKKTISELILNIYILLGFDKKLNTIY